ncbi:MAG: site-specific DNA-methyltransferase [Nitrospirota bacterium]
METQYEKLKKILRQMFQMDQADLDFGIYRIMNQKHEEIEDFLNNDLLPQVKQEIARYKDSEAEGKKRELERLIKTLKDADVEPDTNPKVIKIKEEITEYGSEEALANETFSHLTTFFRRYYDNGDFLSLRRYKKETYAIPYEGEEVKLHWANADQYYIKSSEYLRDYTFKIGSAKKVHFKLVDATEEKDNIKQEQGKERRFKLYEAEPVKIEDNHLYIQFTYLSDRSKQADLNKETLEYINGRINELTDFHEIFSKRPTAKNSKRTLLERHLNDYTARFNFDFFIHKDLGGFLRRELDFYIKNEVLFIDDLDAQDEKKVIQIIGKIKVLKNIALKIISFLAQLEGFQKRLWLKKKFVVACGYCVTLDRVPEDLYEEIAENEEQIKEWVRLFAIDEIERDLIKAAYSNPLTVDFLKANPYLVLDTKFFGERFKERLLASFDNIDEECDGLIINSENFQALSLLQEKYQEKVKCVYIDPPYNTGGDGFVYKDNYQHSSWLTFLSGRIYKSLPLLDCTSACFISIDDTEVHNLRVLGESLFSNNNFVNNVIWWKKYTRSNDAKWFSDNHDHILVFAKDKASFRLNLLPRSDEQNRAYANPDNHPKGPWKSTPLHAKSGNNAIFSYTFRNGVSWSPPPGTYPRFSAETLAKMDQNDEIWFGTSGDSTPSRKSFLCDVKSGLTCTTIWGYNEVGHNHESISELKSLFPTNPFPNPKPTRLVKRVQQLSANTSSLILDYFAGSGTTAHAVINLNREDNGKRKYILVEMGQYFDTVLKPRIQKVVYSKDWKDGRPVSREGISQMFKYMKLESYDDTLDNLIVKRTDKQQMTLDKNKTAKEEYMLGYWLDIETKKSDSLLNIDKFADPFNYTLKIRNDNALKETKIDLVETFNYLIGLYVEQTEVIRGFKVIRGRMRTGEKTLVIWRNTKEKSNKDLDDFFQKQKYNTRDFEFDMIFVNGDNNLENLKVEEDKWKVSLIEQEFKKRMFDIRDI